MIAGSPLGVGIVGCDPISDLHDLGYRGREDARIVAACQAGKHISVQKPMALNVTEADQMIGAAQGAGVILRIFENFGFYRPHVHAKEMIEAEEIGQPYLIRIHLNTGTPDTAWKGKHYAGRIKQLGLLQPGLPVDRPLVHSRPTMI